MTATRSNGNLDILLFDLGGVLLELKCPQETFGLEADEAQFLDKWIRSPAVREFERGAIDAQTFAKSIVSEAALPYDWQEFLQRFDSWPDRLYPGILAILDAIPGRYRRALLSNTNAGHWHQPGVADQLEKRFEKIFLSYQTGHVKPDREAFLLVQNEFGCGADQIAFFDDNPANVAAAAAFGCQSMLTRGIDELRSSLNALGIGV